MAYICPVCRQDSLVVIARIPPATEDYGANSSAMLLLCGHCGLHAVGVDGQTTEKSPSCLGYIVDKGVWTDLHLSWAGRPDSAGLSLSRLTYESLDLLSHDELRAFAMVPAIPVP